MSTQKLIHNIESLSTTLSEAQLKKFLDIMDEMAALMEKAQQQGAVSIDNLNKSETLLMPSKVH